MRLPPVASAVLMAAAGCSSADPSPAGPASPPATAAARPLDASRPRLVFFMNPNGMPCRVQDQILHRMADLSARAELVYYRTTDPGDLARFEQYGIRSLPALVVTDASGRELRRGTPGIQSEAQIRALLGP